MSRFLSKIEKKAKSVDEAIEAALTELGVQRSEVSIRILDEGSKGFLGLGVKEAVVEVSVTDEDSFLAKKFLNEIFTAMEMNVAIDTQKNEDSLEINLSGENMGIVIGKRGDTLDGLQYLTSLVVNRDKDEYTKVSIDTENYREKREEALLALSNRLADKVTKSGKKYTLEPMNPYERRIIHANLQNNENVTTYSIGEEPYRKIVIAPKTERSSFKKGGYKKHSGSRPPHKTPDHGSSINTYPIHKKPVLTNPIPRPVNKNKASSFEEYLAEQEKNANQE